MRCVVVTQQGATGFGVNVPDRPRCIAATETKQGMLQLIHESIEFYLEGLVEVGESVPQPHSRGEFVEVGA